MKIKKYFIYCDIILKMKDIIVIVQICYHTIVKRGTLENNGAHIKPNVFILLALEDDK